MLGYRYSYLLRICTCTVIWLASLHHSLANSQGQATPQSLLELRHSPSAYECAVLSEHVYRDNLEEGDQVVVIDDTQLDERKKVHALHGWIVHKIFREEEDGLLTKAYEQLGLPYGYRGILYLNPLKKQAVLAHRGTQVKNMSSIKTDVFSIASNTIGGQERLVPRWLEQALAIAKEEKCTLTTTGHSLGGWLAQVTAFIAKDQYPERHVKAITFDTPGAKPMLEKIKPRNVPLNLDYLDITNYLSSPNLINACNLHVGTVYRVVFERFADKLGTYTLESHDMSNFLQAFDVQTGKAIRCVEVKDWPLVSKEIIETAINLAGKGGTVDIDIKSLCYLFVLLKKCLNDELLGEYSGFFKFAHGINYYHPPELESKGVDDFDRRYKYHYQTRPFDPHTVSVRHLPEDVRQLLGQFHNNSLPHTIDDKHRNVIEAVEWQQEKGYVRVTSDQDIRCYIDDLVSITTQYASLRQTSPLLVHGTFSINGVLPPPTISLFVGRKNSLRILTQTLNQQNGALIIAPPITGPPGIGKSQLALQVISQQAATQHYDYVFWISAESKQKLLHAYLDLAKGLNIPTDANDPEKIVQNVRQHLRAKHCLYIFDDAPSKEAIEPFFPLQQGHVLVTSHNSSTSAWSQKPISLTPLSQTEALDLAHKFGYRDKDHKVLEKLLAIMPCYPLFLLQLFNIFKYEGISPESFVTATQQSDEKGQEGVLINCFSEEFHPQVRYDKELNMLYVFEKSLASLKKEARGIEALQILSQLAYLYHRNIPVDWLLRLDKSSTDSLKRKTRAALSLLEEYSLIQWDRNAGQLHMHSLTQIAVRYLRKKESLAELIDSLMEYADTVGKDEVYQNCDTHYALLPHGRMIFKRIKQEKYPREACKMAKYLSIACRGVSLYEESMQWAQTLLKLTQQYYRKPKSSEKSYAFEQIFHAFLRFGQYREAMKYAREVLAVRKCLYRKKDHPDMATALNNMGLALKSLGKYQEALQHYEQALAMRKRLYPKQDQYHVFLYAVNIGKVLNNLSRYQEALTYNKQTLILGEQLCGKGDNMLITFALKNIGNSLKGLGKYQEALAYFEQALAVEKRIYQAKGQQYHPYYMAVSLKHVAEILLAFNKAEAALSHYEEVVKILKNLYQDRDHDFLASSFSNLGMVLNQLGRYEEALTYHTQAMAMQTRLFPKQAHPKLAEMLNGTGESLRSLHRFSEALEYYQQGLAMYETLYEHQDHSRIAFALNGIGVSLTKIGHAAKGLHYCKRALAMRQRLCQEGGDHFSVVRYLDDVGGALEQLGRHQEAGKYYKESLEMIKRLYKATKRSYALTSSLQEYEQED